MQNAAVISFVNPEIIDEFVPNFPSREAFANFEPNVVAKMDENDIAAISANKELKLAECRVRCVIENAKCIRKASAPELCLFLAQLFYQHENL
jgi:3-methyladenine DNA glycosylase Tag